MFDLPFPHGSLPGFCPSAGYEAPIYDEYGVKHEPYTDEWHRILDECREVVFPERWNNAGRISRIGFKLSSIAKMSCLLRNCSLRR